MTELNKSRNKHTRGPWRHQRGYNNVFTTSDPKNGVGSTIVIATALASQVAGGADEADANARRIVACVNACEGFSIEELEGANLFKDSIESQNLIDEMLAAQVTESECTTPDFLDWIADRIVHVYGEPEGVDFVVSLRNRAKAGRAVIAKATGSKQ